MLPPAASTSAVIMSFYLTWRVCVRHTHTLSHDTHTHGGKSHATSTRAETCDFCSAFIDHGKIDVRLRGTGENLHLIRPSELTLFPRLESGHEKDEDNDDVNGHEGHRGQRRAPASST